MVQFYGSSQHLLIQGINIMKRVRFAFFAQISLLILLAGCVSQRASFKCPVSPAIVASSSPALVLQKELDGMIARELLPYSVASIKVVSLKSGLTLYETNSYQLMPAASVQKLFTAAAVLSRLGPDHTIETSLAINANNNTLYLRGCGDPLLKTADLKQMVSNLAGKLPPGQHFELVGDTKCFDDAYWGSGWMWDDEPGPEAMYLSALTVNGNTVRVTVTPGEGRNVNNEGDNGAINPVCWDKKYWKNRETRWSLCCIRDKTGGGP